MQGADFVAVGVAQVGQVELACGAFTQTGWVFAGGAAVGHTCSVEGITLFSRLHGEANGAAVAVAGGFAVDGRGDGEGAGGAAVEIVVPEKPLKPA